MKILVVEDEAIVAESLAASLEKLGYEVMAVAHSYSEALDVLSKQTPDLALLDVMLGGFKDGIDLGAELREGRVCPFVYLTSYSDKTTVERAKATKPNGYLVKPFSRDDIYAAIEVALANHAGGEAAVKEEGAEPAAGEGEDRFIIRDALFVKTGHAYHKIAFSDVLWLKAEANYTAIFTGEKKHMVRGSLKEMESVLPESLFYRIHKSFVVNLSAVESIEPSCVRIGQEEIPLGKSFRDPFLRRIRTL